MQQSPQSDSRWKQQCQKSIRKLCLCFRPNFVLKLQTLMRSQVSGLNNVFLLCRAQCLEYAESISKSCDITWFLLVTCLLLACFKCTLMPQPLTICSLLGGGSLSESFRPRTAHGGKGDSCWLMPFLRKSSAQSLHAGKRMVPGLAVG